MKVSVLLVLFATVYSVASSQRLYSEFGLQFPRPNWFPTPGFTSLFQNDNCNCELFDKHFGDGWLNWLPDAMMQAERNFNRTEQTEQNSDDDNGDSGAPGSSLGGDSCPTGRTRVGNNCLDVD